MRLLVLPQSNCLGNTVGAVLGICLDSRESCVDSNVEDARLMASEANVTGSVVTAVGALTQWPVRLSVGACCCIQSRTLIGTLIAIPSVVVVVGVVNEH
jgi:hypothetical protein